MSTYSEAAQHGVDGTREIASANYEGTVFACLCGARYEDKGELEQHVDEENAEPEPHVHTCQQCDKVVTADCTCTRGQYMTWCSSNCRAAYDL
jgi:hypothetical protein